MANMIDNNVCVGVDTVPAATTRDGLFLPGFQDHHYPYATLRYHELSDGQLDFVEFVPRSHYIWMNYADDLDHHRISELDAADTARGRFILKRLRPMGIHHPRRAPEIGSSQGIYELEVGSPLLPLTGVESRKTDEDIPRPRAATEAFERTIKSPSSAPNTLLLRSHEKEGLVHSKVKDNPSAFLQAHEKEALASASLPQTNIAKSSGTAAADAVSLAELPAPSRPLPSSASSDSISATPTELYKSPDAGLSTVRITLPNSHDEKMLSELQASTMLLASRGAETGCVTVSCNSTGTTAVELYAGTQAHEVAGRSSPSDRSARVLSLLESTNELTISTLKLAESTRKLLNATAEVAKTRRAERNTVSDARVEPAHPVVRDSTDSAQARIPADDKAPVLPEIPELSSLSSISLPSSRSQDRVSSVTESSSPSSRRISMKAHKRLPKPSPRSSVMIPVVELGKVTINDTADAVITFIPAPPPSAYPGSVELPLHLQGTMTQSWIRGLSLGQIADIFKLHGYGFFDAETKENVRVEYLIMRFLMAKGLWKKNT